MGTSHEKKELWRAEATVTVMFGDAHVRKHVPTFFVVVNSTPYGGEDSTVLRNRCKKSAMRKATNVINALAPEKTKATIVVSKLIKYDEFISA